jgi:hypothetical protein
MTFAWPPFHVILGTHTVRAGDSPSRVVLQGPGFVSDASGAFLLLERGPADV